MATGTSKKQINTILDGQINNFRQIIKSNDLSAIGEIRNELTLTILYIANTYTGANFNNPPTKDDWISLRACSNLVLDMFPCFGMAELELAFKMAAAGKFPDLNLETYYGKFTVNFLGKILREYKKSRNKIIMKHDELKTKEEREMTPEQICKENERAKKSIISKFINLKERYNAGEEICFDRVYSFWARILIDTGHIDFRDNIKKEIWNEAQQIAKEKLLNRIQSNKKTQLEKRTLKELFKKIEAGEQTDDFNQMSILEYSKLLVIKAITND